VRLTVVTIFGLIGTVTTGFLGMNLFAESDASWPTKALLFLLVFIPTIALTVYTMVKSKRLSDFLDVVSDERISTWNKIKSFVAVWGRGSD
jgi:cell division protein FtsW (lipid II flippase)